MLDVFLDVIAPVLAMALLGGVVGRRFDVPVEVLSNLVFNLFAPALVFRTLSTVELSGDTARIAGATLLVLAGSAILSLLASWARRHDATTRATVALGSSVSNGGNMGLPVALLAFGQFGLEVAVLAFEVGGIWANSAGVMLASMAGGSTTGALRAPFTAPALWAAAAALVVNALDLDIPIVVSASASTVSTAHSAVSPSTPTRTRSTGSRSGTASPRYSSYHQLTYSPPTTTSLGARRTKSGTCYTAA